VDATNHVHLKLVSISSDMGNVVDVNGGIGLQDRIIDNPPDSIENGDPVRVIAAPPPAPAN
jgi:hypothetical protein